jgi:hypothetical protein
MGRMIALRSRCPMGWHKYCHSGNVEIELADIISFISATGQDNKGVVKRCAYLSIIGNLLGFLSAYKHVSYVLELLFVVLFSTFSASMRVLSAVRISAIKLSKEILRKIV